MSLWTRLANVFRGERLSRELDEEFESHLEEAIRDGRDPDEAKRAFGSLLRQRESSRDIRLVAWLDALRADVVFGWRQLRKRKAISAAAVLSLGLATGSCMAAFRLIDALLWRPLPISHPERLYIVAQRGVDPGGNLRIGESGEYPLFRQLRAAAQGSGEMLAVSYADKVDLTYRSDEEMERPYLQYVSGWMFSTFGLQPAVGRLLTSGDDQTPRAHSLAVLSYDYWTRRFARDPHVVGRRFRMGDDSFEIVGVCNEGFTGTEPGIIVDVFVPTMMNPYVTRDDASWFRPLLVLNPGVQEEPLRQKLHAVVRRFNEGRASKWTAQTKSFLNRFLDQTVLLLPAYSGVSGMQRNYRLPLIVMGVLVLLVLLTACSNVANLMTAQAASRAREMALRASIGAGQWRLLQLVMVESVWLGMFAALAGGVIAWWAAPHVASGINPPGNPAQLVLPTDWRVLGFGLTLSLGVTLLFGLVPALRASSVKPANALKGGEDPHSRRRLMHGLIAAQVAFCFVVHFASGLFVTTFERLSNQPTGFSSERMLVIATSARPTQPPQAWYQTLEHLRALPGVQKIALAGWTLLSGNGWNGFIWVDSVPTGVLGYFLGVSPGWRETMQLPLIAGRELRDGEAYPSVSTTGVALVNEAFVKQCLHGQSPLGRWFEKETGNGVTRDRFQIVGVVANARYRNMREPITPTAYVPFPQLNAKGILRSVGTGTFIIQTASDDPTSLAQAVRKEITQSNSAFHVSSNTAQTEINLQHTVRERLLATLAVFFAGVALLLAGVGIFGALNYSVLQRRKEFGIRMAIGAKGRDIARRVTVDVFSMVAVGGLAGLGLGLGSVHYIKALLYGIEGTEGGNLVLPSVMIVAAALLAALPPVLRAVRIDPVKMLHSE